MTEQSAAVTRTTINPDGVFDSVQYGFSQAVVVTGGTTVHVSGQVAWDPDSGAAGITLAEQVPGAFDNLARVLDAAGGSLQDVVSLRIYIVEGAAGDLTPVGDALRARFSTPPASTWIVVSRLADPTMLVEIEAVAVLAPA